MIRPAFVPALALALALTPLACKSCDPASNPKVDAGDHATSNLLSPEQNAQVLAKVGEKTITLGDYTAALEHMDQFDRLRYQSPERRKELLDEMITVELLAQEATEKGYDKDPLAQQELRAILRDAMLAEARKGAPAPADIPAEEVRAYFDSHRADYKDPERRRVSVIVLATEASATEVLNQAKTATSAQWGELVRGKSLDVHARDNVPIDLAGDYGIVSPPGDPRGENARVPNEVRAAVFQIAELGKVYEKVVSVGGNRHYVVRLTQKLEPHERSYEEAERSIRVKLAQDKLRLKEDELLAELKKTVKVEIDEGALATVKVEMPDAAALKTPVPIPPVDGGAPGK